MAREHGRRNLDGIEHVGVDPGHDGLPSRVHGGERFRAASHRPKPLHWTRIRMIAAAAGTVVGLLVSIALTGGNAPAAFALMLAGCITGLLIVVMLEARGVFRRTDEL